MSNWKNDYISAKFPQEQIVEMKKQYGKLLATHDRDSEGAFVDPQMDVIFAYDVSAKIYAKNNWVFDLDVQKHLEHYLSEGINEVLPTKEKVAKMMLDIAKTTHTPREKLLALEKYAEIMGYTIAIKEPTGNVQNVVLISDNGDETSWEEKMRKQQHELKTRAEELLAEHE